MLLLKNDKEDCCCSFSSSYPFISLSYPSSSSSSYRYPSIILPPLLALFFLSHCDHLVVVARIPELNQKFFFSFSFSSMASWNASKERIKGISADIFFN
jgi:hypothetical protein